MHRRTLKAVLKEIRWFEPSQRKLYTCTHDKPDPKVEYKKIGKIKQSRNRISNVSLSIL